jgi:DNA invertase Pin-like site-specific DNA recombinase
MITSDPLLATDQPRLMSRPYVEPLGSPSRPAKIQPWHLERLAVVYVRQSSPYQVMHNKESADVQSGFRYLAIAWDWPADRVIVVSDDQAKSGTTADGRLGFQWLLNEVNLDHVGIILGFQVSRLSRANSDWYRLLERCAVFHTLLADQDGVYDPTQHNDRLLLGLKGTMSEAELYFLKQRLSQARLNKARRGELFTKVPTGYIRLPADRVALDPDEQVQLVVRLIFDKFDELGSVYAVLRYLVRHEIKLGMRVQSGPEAGRLEWHRPIHGTLNTIIRHPFYAGCYAYGLRRNDPRRRRPGRPHSGQVRVEPLKWEVMIPDKVPAYITWDRYLCNQERLAANRCLPTAVGAPRRGPSLLSGLVYCARCGRRMQVAYHAKGAPVYYRCHTLSAEYGEPSCQALAGGSLEALVTEEVLKVLEPAKLELCFQAVADLDRERQRLDEHWQKRLERARIEAQRAARQYHAVEPEDRLVARELERRWEQALREQRGLEEQYDRFKAEAPREPTAADRQRIEAWADDLAGLWKAPSTTIEDRKTMVRFLVERITVGIRGQTEWVDVTIRWAGGKESRHEVCRPVNQYEQLSNYQVLRDRMIELRRAGATTGEIAGRLNREGFHPPRGPAQFTRSIVKQFLVRQGLLGPGTRRRISSEDLGRHEWRMGDLARELEMAVNTMRNWHDRGWVLGRMSAEIGGAWILWADEAELERLRRLRCWRPVGADQRRPPELTTPRGRKERGRNRSAKASRNSDRYSIKNKISTNQ